MCKLPNLPLNILLQWTLTNLDSLVLNGCKKLEVVGDFAQISEIMYAFCREAVAILFNAQDNNVAMNITILGVWKQGIWISEGLYCEPNELIDSITTFMMISLFPAL